MEATPKEQFDALIDGRYKVFLDEKGLSMTEANHKANMLSEYAKTTEAKFSHLKGYSQVLDFNQRDVVTHKDPVIDNLEEAAQEDGILYSASAWLREGVTAKEIALTQIRTIAPEKLLIGEEEFEVNMLDRPVHQSAPFKSFTDDDIMDTWTVAERFEHLALQAKASHLGKKVHPKGILSNVRENILNLVDAEFIEKGHGNLATVYVATNTPTYTVEEINKTTTTLQDKYRDYQARYNYGLAKMQNEVSAKNQQAVLEQKTAQEAFDLEYNTLYEAYNKEVKRVALVNQQLRMTAENRRLKLVNYISKLKIVVPKGIEEILAKVSPVPEEAK